MHSGNFGGWVLSGAVDQEAVGQTGQEWSAEPAASCPPSIRGCVLEPEVGQRHAVMGRGGSMQMAEGQEVVTGKN